MPITASKIINRYQVHAPDIGQRMLMTRINRTSSRLGRTNLLTNLNHRESIMKSIILSFSIFHLIFMTTTITIQFCSCQQQQSISKSINLTNQIDDQTQQSSLTTTTTSTTSTTTSNPITDKFELSSSSSINNLVNLNQTVNSNGNQNLADPPVASVVQVAQQNAPVVATNGVTNPYQLKIIRHDAQKDVILVSLMPVESPNEHEPRIELRSQFQMGPRYPFVIVDERAPNDTFVAAIVVSDPDPGPRGQVDVSIDAGNELNDFKLIKLVTASNLYSILVNKAPLSRARVQEYNLNIVARDRGQPPKYSSLNLMIKVNSTQPNNQWSLISSDLTAEQSRQASIQSRDATNELMDIARKLVILFVLIVFLIMFTCALVNRSNAELKKTALQRKNLLQHNLS